MTECKNLNTVILFSSDKKVIDLCCHALSSVCTVNVMSAVPSSTIPLPIFSMPVIVDAQFFTKFSKQIAALSVKNSHVIFLVRGSDCEQLLEKREKCIPFPCDLDMLRNTVQSQFSHSQEIMLLPHVKQQNIDVSGFEKLVGASEAILAVKQQLAHVAAKELTVLLLGESGTGKTLAAELLHKNSRRCAKKFVSVDMTTVVEGLAESDLFGTVPGAYTGAVKRAGRFAKADGGTLFLDEIGELSLALQPKLLRVIETGNYCNVGSDAEHHVDVRLICATNENLQTLTQSGKFRIDLYYRIADYTVVMPPLRKRFEDIAALAESFLVRSGKQLSDSAYEKLMQHDWPGNIRQLKSCLHRACILSQENIILPEVINF